MVRRRKTSRKYNYKREEINKRPNIIITITGFLLVISLGIIYSSINIFPITGYESIVFEAQTPTDGSTITDTHAKSG